VEYSILGPLEVAVNGRPVPLGGTKQRALLAILLLHRNEVVPTDRLIEDLWGDDVPAAAAKTVQVHISRLRKALDSPALETRPRGYALRVDADQFDLQRFEVLTKEGRRRLAGGDAAGARSALDDALTLWRGPALADFAYEPFAVAEIARLEELRIAANEDRLDADLALGQHNAAVPELEALIAAHPLRERLRRQLMLALYRGGRQAEALESYRDARSTLDELGIEPSRALRELEGAILRHDPSLDAPAAQPSATARPGRRAAGAFVGREGELAELLAGLDDALAGRGRLFLVSGEAGVGKTRLADELASRAKERGARVLWGRCWRDGDAPAYWPWRQALRRVGDLPTTDDRFALFAAVGELLHDESATQPILLVLDDLHAADASSLELLGFVAGELAELHVEVLGTYAEHAKLAAPLEALAHHSAHHLLPLRGLDVEQVARFLELVGGEGDAPALHSQTAGNPRLLWQRVRGT
jgi:DNA-binding SARP family transcriptional activator